MLLALTLEQRFHVVIGVFGSFYVCFLLTNASSLSFHELYARYSIETNVSDRQGFVSFFNWMETILTVESINSVIKLFTNNQTMLLKIIYERMDVMIKEQVCLQLSKIGLQCGLLLFLYKVKGIEKKKIVIPTMSLTILTLICWKMTQSCMREILVGLHVSDQKDSLKFRVQFLHILFLIRWGAMVCIHLIFARGYQLYFCHWPEKWIQIPRYLGSKNLMLSTLYFGTAMMSLIALVTPNLRCLTEAAAQVESFALGASLIHYIGRLLNFQEKQQAETIDPDVLSGKEKED